MAALQFYQFPCLEDNYGVLIHDPDSKETAAIDAPEAAAVRQALELKGWSLTHLFCTHHHVDHTAGIAELKQLSGCTVYGPKGESAKIPALDIALGEGDELTFGGRTVEIIETPGHTLGHMVYYIPSDTVAFAADTMFPLGCGRVFEGTLEQMWSSLAKLIALPKETIVYCGHEYTKANAKFALSIEPGNAALQKRAAEIDEKRARGEPTVPTTIALELETSPFVRPRSPEIQERLGMVGHSDAEIFAEVRRRKDNF